MACATKSLSYFNIRIKESIVNVSVACATKSLSYIDDTNGFRRRRSQWRVLQNLSLTLMNKYVKIKFKSQWRVLQNLSLTIKSTDLRTNRCLSGVCYKISLLPGFVFVDECKTVSVACATKSLSYLLN